ncbi:MAG: hypothetical protein PF501_03740 [Salinisphaera sp.]|nr:hypothetical protein [Salinisphaera sp.]
MKSVASTIALTAVLVGGVTAVSTASAQTLGETSVDSGLVSTGGSNHGMQPIAYTGRDAHHDRQDPAPVNRVGPGSVSIDSGLTTSAESNHGMHPNATQQAGGHVAQSKGEVAYDNVSIDSATPGSQRGQVSQHGMQAAQQD